LTDDELIEAALAEDVGDGDATTAATVDEPARGRATITQKAPGVISGLDLAAAVFRHLDPSAAIQLGPEGVWRETASPQRRCSHGTGPADHLTRPAMPRSRLTHRNKC